jgi:hypothetical protein
MRHALDHRPERRRRLLGGMLLHRADDRVQEQHRGDEDGAGLLADEQRDDRRDHEDVDERAEELAQEGRRDPRHRRLGQGIGAVRAQPVGGLGAGQALVGELAGAIVGHRRRVLCRTAARPGQ